ncbi:hypothetical protein D3C83_97150 [compost metagenome]
MGQGNGAVLAIDEQPVEPGAGKEFHQFRRGHRDQCAEQGLTGTQARGEAGLTRRFPRFFHIRPQGAGFLE